MIKRIVSKGLMVAITGALLSSCTTLDSSEQDKSRDQFDRDEVTISILSLNDLHGGGLAVNQKFSIGLPGNRKPVDIGGPAAMKAYFESVIQKNPQGVLILDAGDSYQGSLVSNNSRGQAVVSLYNYLGIDASTIGNHEFDWGGILASSEALQDGYESPFLRVVEKSNHVFLAHNMSFRDQPLERINGLNDHQGIPYDIFDSAGNSKLASFAMFERNGVRIAVVGGITETAMDSSSPKNYRDVAIKGIGDGLVELIQNLKSNRDAQVVVLLMHAGFSCNFTSFDYQSDQNNTSAQCPGDSTSDEIRSIFAKIKEDGHQPKELIDVVVAGHVHSPQAHYYDNVPVIQNTDKGLGFGRVDITYKHSENAVVARKIFPSEILCHHHFESYPGCNPNGPAVNQPYPPALGQKVGPVYAGEPVDVTSRTGEAKMALAEFDDLFRKKDQPITNLGYALVHDRFKESVMDRCYVDAIQLAADVDLVIAISGGIRESLPQGPVTAGNIFEVAPFDGGAVEVMMTGTELKAYIAMDNKDFTQKSMPIISAGWKLKVNCEAPGQEVKPLEIFEFDHAGNRWKAVNGDHAYKVVISAYLFENSFFDNFRSERSRVIQSERELLTAGFSRDDRPESCAMPPGALPSAPEIKMCDDSHADSRWCGLSADCPL